jgi:hypothetical protein
MSAAILASLDVSNVNVVINEWADKVARDFTNPEVASDQALFVEAVAMIKAAETALAIGTLTRWWQVEGAYPDSSALAKVAKALRVAATDARRKYAEYLEESDEMEREDMKEDFVGIVAKAVKKLNGLAEVVNVSDRIPTSLYSD